MSTVIDLESLRYRTEPVYTRADLDRALEQQGRSLVINRVIQRGKDYDTALQIVEVFRTPDGTLVIVR